MTEKGIILNIEIGIIKELFKNELITETQKNKAIQILKVNYIDEINSRERNVKNKKSSSVL